MIPNLLLYPDKCLTSPTVEVTEFNPLSLDPLIRDMKDACNAYGGIGIAANQIGDNRRVCLVIHDGEEHIFINPKVLKFDGPPLGLEEGCLSLPGVVVKLDCRRELVEVSAQDIEGKVFVYTALALEALKLQHEIDHLDGQTLFSRMAYAKRVFLRKKYQKDSKKYGFHQQLANFTERMRNADAIHAESVVTSADAESAGLPPETDSA